jgi:hypothetical protein
MAFLVGSMSIEVYTDPAQTNFPQQIIMNQAPTWTDNNVSQVQTSTIVLAASGSQVINLNGITGITGFYIYSSATAINVNLNGLGNIQYQFGVPGYVPASVTAMTITNTSSSVPTTVTISLIVG